MSDKLFANLNLSEDYIIHVLGYNKSSLNEGTHSLALHYDIIEAHMITEGWFDQGIKYLKDKGVKGYEKIKDKAFEVPNAIKQYGKDITGIVAAITAMVNDPDEAKAYAKGIFEKVKKWPENLIKKLSNILNWVKSKKLIKISEPVKNLIELLKKMWLNVGKIKGVARTISMLAFGLAVTYLEEEFNILKKTEKTAKYIEDEEIISKDFTSFLGDKAKEYGIDQIKNFFTKNDEDLDKYPELINLIIEFIKEKIEFLEEVKQKFIDIGKDLAGQALAQFAGPIAWIKSVIDFFGKTSWVINNLAEMLSQPFYDEPDPIKN